MKGFRTTGYTQPMTDIHISSPTSKLSDLDYGGPKNDDVIMTSGEVDQYRVQFDRAT